MKKQEKIVQIGRTEDFSVSCARCGSHNCSSVMPDATLVCRDCRAHFTLWGEFDKSLIQKGGGQ